MPYNPTYYDLSRQSDSDKPAIIFVFGRQGVGKTTFVSDASSCTSGVGHNSEPYTKEVQAGPVLQLDDRKVQLFDTPGFNAFTDADTFKSLVETLGRLRENSQKIIGLLYFCKITDNKLTSASAQAFESFMSICGLSNMLNTLIVTNMWSYPDDPEDINRERELQKGVFKSAIEHGARMARRSGPGCASADAIVRTVLRFSSSPITLRLQAQIACGTNLCETDAGILVNQKLQAQLARLLQGKKDFGEELQEAQCNGNRSEEERLEWIVQDFEAQAARLQQKIQELKKPAPAQDQLANSKQPETQSSNRTQVPRLFESSGLETAIILVFGGTGAGKTTFVRDASRGALMSLPRQVQASSVFRLDGRKVQLYDIPGFDNILMKSTDILKSLVQKIGNLQKNDQIMGLLFFQRITEDVDAQAVELFMKICGQSNMQKALIVTNMWSYPNDPKELDLERKLQEGVFKSAIEHGARMARRSGPGHDSADAIVRTLLDFSRSPIELRLQVETTINRVKKLCETDAGKLIEEKIVYRLRQLREEKNEAEIELEWVREDEEELMQSHFEEMIRDLKNEEKRLDRMVKDLNIRRPIRIRSNSLAPPSVIPPGFRDGRRARAFQTPAYYPTFSSDSRNQTTARITKRPIVASKRSVFAYDSDRFRRMRAHWSELGQEGSE